MKYWTLENIKQDENQDLLYDLFDPKLVYDPNIKLYPRTVESDENMRLDWLLQKEYGHSDYIDEICNINGLIDQYSIKMGDEIFLIVADDITNLHYQEVNTVKYVDKNKNNVIDKNREPQKTLPITKPKELKNVNIDHQSQTIKIINKFQ